ncbi:MAG: inositol monophosphatase family protein [Pseudomonadota bacterium]
MSFPTEKISEFSAFAMRLADLARAETLPRFRNGADVTDKTGAASDLEFDPVTDADREGERVIRDLIAKTYPDHGVIGEEFGATKGDGPWRWVLDPVDGTRAFVCGVATWTTLIALEHEGAPVLGLIDQPFTKERWLASNGETVFHRGGETRACRTSGVTDLVRARISTTDPRPESYFGDAPAGAFRRLAAASRVARFSMDAYAYALLALGELDVVAENSLQLHDYAALAPVVESAGGVITNWNGDPLGSDDRGEALAAATPELHAAALASLNK